MKKTPIRDFIYDTDNLVQIACTYSNCGLIGVYLTNSGMVTREEFGYVEDCVYKEGDIMENGQLYKILWLKVSDFNRIKRIQNILQKIEY